MTYVVTEPCINCKHTDCVEVCPVDAFHEGPNFLAINPEVCIDCAVCVAACPVEAICADSEVPPGMEKYIALNAELSRKWQPIVRRMEPLPEASHWATIKEKLGLLKGA